MKELKALEILRDNFIVCNDENITMYRQDHIKKAIEELEALENKKCDNCKHYKQSSTQIYKTCYANKVNGFNLESDIDFSCNKWEVKNES